MQYAILLPGLLQGMPLKFTFLSFRSTLLIARKSSIPLLSLKNSTCAKKKTRTRI